MMVVDRLRLAALWLALAAVSAASAPAADFTPPASRPEATALNVILFIGDGMGPQQVRAGSLFATGDAGGLSFQKLPHHATAVTDSATPNGPTDSAAAATALATGIKVNNGVVSMRMPGDSGDLVTIAELMKAKGAATGFVTTDSLVGATPAGFFAHAPSRGSWKKIAGDYADRVKPDVLMGAGYPGVKAEQFTAAGYTMLRNAADLDAEAARLADGKKPRPLCGMFPGDRFTYLYHDELDAHKRYGTDYPKMAPMTRVAIDTLARRGGDRGFFLMVESALIDKSGHADRVRDKDADRTHVNIRETAQLAEAVAAAVEWAAKQKSPTLIVVTADHETGGLAVVEPRGKGVASICKWSHNTHTRTPVDVWTNGVGAGADLAGRIDNTDIFRLMARAAGVADGAARPTSETDLPLDPAKRVPLPEPAGID